MEIVLAVIGGLAVALAGLQMASITVRLMLAGAYRAYCELSKEISETYLAHRKWQEEYRERRAEFLKSLEAE
jgi:hypothetical protein